MPMSPRPSVTAHCIVKNEEVFVGYAIRSVVDYVDSVIVFDTGSTDTTPNIVRKLQSEYPDKIVFHEKGPCTGIRHTELRQEMLDLTNTDWFMIVDGDEVWTDRGMREAFGIISSDNKAPSIIAPYYLCVGDIYHHSLRGLHFYIKFFQITSGIRWNQGPYGEGDFVVDANGQRVGDTDSVALANRYWHASALIRSSDDASVSLGRHKQVLTYHLKILNEGLAIREAIPDVFKRHPSVATQRLSTFKSLVNLLVLILFKIGISRKRYLWTH